MYEVQKFTSLDGHIYDPMPLIANLDWFKGLTVEQQNIVEIAALLGQNYSRAVNSAREDYIIGLLREKGMEVNAVSEAEKAKMREATQTQIVGMIKEKTDPAFVDQWLSSIEQARKDVKSGL